MLENHRFPRARTFLRRGHRWGHRRGHPGGTRGHPGASARRFQGHPRFPMLLKPTFCGAPDPTKYTLYNTRGHPHAPSPPSVPLPAPRRVRPAAPSRILLGMLFQVLGVQSGMSLGVLVLVRGRGAHSTQRLSGSNSGCVGNYKSQQAKGTGAGRSKEHASAPGTGQLQVQAPNVFLWFR